MSNVVQMMSTFQGAISFNQPLDQWDVGNVEYMDYMFYEASGFNQDISMWDTSRLTVADYMFAEAVSFDQDLSARNMENVRSAYEMFTNSALSTYNYNEMLHYWSKQNLQGWVNLGAFPTKYGGCVANAAIGIAGHNNLSGIFNWNITDGGKDNCDNPFITTWRLDYPNETIQIPTEYSTNLYDFEIDWGDGSAIEYYSGSNPYVDHIYANAGDYQVEIRGDFPRIYFANIGNEPRLISVDQWGSIHRDTMSYAFAGCQNMNVLATDAPDLSNVTDLSYMFLEVIALTGNLNHWNVSNVTNMEAMFGLATSFNSPLNNWDVSNVENMGLMFAYAYDFDQNINTWDTSNVQSTMGMFAFATNYNQPLS